MSLHLLTVSLKYEHDTVLARQRTRQLTALLGFDAEDQTRMATAVSEIARNAFQYAGGGKVEFIVEGRTPPQLFQVKVSDTGPGIASLTEILEGRYQSRTGMGLGILGARRLVDQFRIESATGAGTTVWLTKLFPRAVPVLNKQGLRDLMNRLSAEQPDNPLAEMQRQNQELMRTLDELRQHQQELLQLNRELEDTNRGVVALYAELDEKADHLRRADELKSRFLSNMSHEFRTPLNSIQALCRILLDRVDGELTTEQERQVSFVKRAAEDLYELVNDLLDLAKIEAGKIVVRPGEFQITTLFSALRGMLKPLLVNPSVQLVFEEPDALPAMHTDEGKVSQILRNFLSNALKFTQRGEVRLSAALSPDGDAIIFSVSDTGIGIAAADQERIFQEFGQIEHPIQQSVKGTGLGLPLSKKLAHLMGGEIWVRSEVGLGSTFFARVPIVYQLPAPTTDAPVLALDATLTPILLVEDEEATILLYEKYLKGTGFQVVPVRTLAEARHVLSLVRPKAVILDLMLKGEDSWLFLSSLKADAATREIPVLVVTTLEDRQKAYALGADAYCVKPVARAWLLHELSIRTKHPAADRILIIDDEPASRYILTNLLKNTLYRVVEAADGRHGLALARTEQPRAILLDLVMPDMSGVEILTALKQDPGTSGIPVVVVSSKLPSQKQPERRLEGAAAVLSKQDLTRERLLEVVGQVCVPLRSGVEA